MFATDTNSALSTARTTTPADCLGATGDACNLLPDTTRDGPTAEWRCGPGGGERDSDYGSVWVGFGNTKC